MSKINVNTWEPEGASTAATLMASGDTVTVPSGAELDIASGATLDVNGTLDVTGATVTGLTTGKILQVVSDTSPGGDTTTTSTTFDTIKSGLATIITPASATNKILLLGTCSMGTSNDEMAGAFSLYKNASDFTETYDLISGVDPVITDGEGWGVSYRLGGNPGADGTFIAGLTYLDTANTTNAITYSISTRVAGGSGTITLASPRTTVTLIAMEIAV